MNKLGLRQQVEQALLLVKLTGDLRYFPSAELVRQAK